VKTKEKELILRKYDIDIVALEEKTYLFSYHADEKFFQCFELTLFSKGNCKVDITLAKSSTMLTINFDIQGTIELECDRSLELFDYPVEIQERIFFKYGEQAGEWTEEVVIIPRNTATINLASYIYELVALAVPMRKIHPKFEDDEEDDFVDEYETLIYTSDESEAVEDEAEIPEEIDPRWAKLNQLKK
jgi:uncharacterized protein